MTRSRRGWRCSSADRVWPRNRCCVTEVGTAHRATGCSARSRSTPGTGSRRRGKSERPADAHLAYFTELDRDRGAASAPRPSSWNGSAVARGRARQHRFGAARRARGRRGDGGDAARGGRGWYWWLGGHKAEGIELITAAAAHARRGERRDPGHGVRAGRDVRWPTARRTSTRRRSGSTRRSRLTRAQPARQPAAGVRRPAGTHAAGAADARLPAFEPLLTDEDPWVRALARLQLGKMRIMLGQGGREADAYLEMALAEFRALGER